MNNILAARITAQNKANAKAAEMQPQLRAVVETLIGQNIIKADGTLMKKYKNLFPKYTDSSWLKVTMHLSSYSLAWEVYVSEPIQGSQQCVFEKAMVHVARMNNGCIVSLHDEWPYRTDYTIGEVEENRRRHDEASKAKMDAYDKLYPFGEYDR